MGPSPLARNYNTDEPKRNNSKTSVLMLRFVKVTNGINILGCHSKDVIINF